MQVYGKHWEGAIAHLEKIGLKTYLEEQPKFGVLGKHMRNYLKEVFETHLANFVQTSDLRHRLSQPEPEEATIGTVVDSDDSDDGSEA